MTHTPSLSRFKVVRPSFENSVALLALNFTGGQEVEGEGKAEHHGDSK